MECEEERCPAGPASTPMSAAVVPEAQITNLCSRCTVITTFLQMLGAAYSPLAHHSQKLQLGMCKQNKDCIPVNIPENTIRPQMSYYSCLYSRIGDLSSPSAQINNLVSHYVKAARSYHCRRLVTLSTKLLN